MSMSHGRTLTASVLSSLVIALSTVLSSVLGESASEQQHKSQNGRDEQLVLAAYERYKKGDLTATNILAEIASDETRSEKARERAVRILSYPKNRENLRALGPFLGSASDRVRTAAYFELPREVREELGFDFTRRPTPQELKELQAKLEAEIDKYIAQSSKEKGDR